MRKLRPKYKDFANPATAMHHSENKPKINQGSSCTTKTHSIHALYIIKPSYKVSCMTQASKPKESSKSTKMAQVHQSDQANSGSYQGTSFLLLLTCQVVSCSGDGKDSGDGQKIPTAISLQPENSGCFELGFGQPMICAKYPYADQYYGVFSAYGAQISGRIMLPLNLATDDGPVYVNAKQYHGIIRRRNSRAKAVLENKLTRKRKPYMHHSRHLHAMRRPRGCGGRFLNKETQSGSAGTKEKKSGIQQLPQPTCSRISEVLQSESGTLGSPKEANGSSSNLSGSEVTSMYSRGGFDHFRVCHLGPSIHSFSGIMDSGRGIVMPSHGVAAADNCCNLKV